ncbi:hypothetical protein HPB50_018870 [Hyalomma asiaticum]|uniref:Uncharacterized protein n=1 Tax=Hyalomma asiaticum TaxID=266040 RepID=A0ACB7SGD1_HYAAI|nr:hypothetical protein HPB50_018870 [Hyalomma asiaticum]
MDVVHVEGTTLQAKDYNPADWTTVIGTYKGKSQSKARMHDQEEASEEQKAREERTATLPASAWRPAYRPNSAQLRATQQVTRNSRQMAPLPQHANKVVFRSQGGQFMPNIQPQLLLRCLCSVAKVPLDADVEIGVHPTNNTCTVAPTSEDAALNLAKVRSLTLNGKAYVIAAYIAPAADTNHFSLLRRHWRSSMDSDFPTVAPGSPIRGCRLSVTSAEDSPTKSSLDEAG